MKRNGSTRHDGADTPAFILDEHIVATLRRLEAAAHSIEAGASSIRRQAAELAYALERDTSAAPERERKIADLSSQELRDVFDGDVEIEDIAR